MDKKINRLLLSLGLCILCPQLVFADSKPDFYGEVGINVWASSAETSWNHDARSLTSLAGNPTSRLSYEKVKSAIIELHGTLHLPQHLALEARLGYGTINDGQLLDDDYLSASGATAFGAPAAGLVSRTFSEIDGDDLQFGSLSLLREIRRWRSKKTRFNVLAGMQRWRETYTANGVNQLVCNSVQFCNPVGFSAFQSTRVVTNTVEWRNLNIGLDGMYQINDKFGLGARIGIIPIAKLKNEDTHHLRTDLSSNPSFSMRGTGQGINLDFNANYAINNNLLVYAGLRYWKMKVKNENNGWTVHTPSGSVSADLNEFRSERGGITLGLIYRPTSPVEN